MATRVLKLSVLTDGRVLLNGDAVPLTDLPSLIGAQPKEDAVIWYYRENASGEPPPAALQVMKLVTDRRLPIRLFAKPDFSDTVTPEAASGMAPVFAAMRQRAAERQLVILRPDGRVIMLPALAKEDAPPHAVAAIERLLPSSVKRNVAAVADTSWTQAQTPNVSEAGRAIPFFGTLMGFATIGHSVWIFDIGAAAELAAGCRDADLVIVDSARLGVLPANWQSLVASVMRTPQMVVFDRATGRLRKA